MTPQPSTAPQFASTLQAAATVCGQGWDMCLMLERQSNGKAGFLHLLQCQGTSTSPREQWAFVRGTPASHWNEDAIRRIFARFQDRINFGQCTVYGLTFIGVNEADLNTPEFQSLMQTAGLVASMKHLEAN